MIVKSKNIVAVIDFPMVASADNISFKTGIAGSMTLQISKDGGALAAVTVSPTELGATGVFTVTLTADQMNADSILLFATDAAALDQPIFINTTLPLDKAAVIYFVMVDPTDAVTLVTGLAGSMTTQITKDGGALAGTTNAATEIGATGVYVITLTTAEISVTSIGLLITDAAALDQFMIIPIRTALAITEFDVVLTDGPFVVELSDEEFDAIAI